MEVSPAADGLALVGITTDDTDSLTAAVNSTTEATISAALGMNVTTPSSMSIDSLAVTTQIEVVGDCPLGYWWEAAAPFRLHTHIHSRHLMNT